MTRIDKHTATFRTEIGSHVVTLFKARVTCTLKEMP